MTNLNKIKSYIEQEFPDIIDDVIVSDLNEMRIILYDSSFVDVWYSLKLKGRYSYHWERRFIDNTVYRHDNIPHKKWENIKTFPKHFHFKTQSNVRESDISSNVKEGIVDFLGFVRTELHK